MKSTSAASQCILELKNGPVDASTWPPRPTMPCGCTHSMAVIHCKSERNNQPHSKHVQQRCLLFDSGSGAFAPSSKTTSARAKYGVFSRFAAFRQGIHSRAGKKYLRRSNERSVRRYSCSCSSRHRTRLRSVPVRVVEDHAQQRPEVTMPRAQERQRDHEHRPAPESVEARDEHDRVPVRHRAATSTRASIWSTHTAQAQHETQANTR